MYCADCGKKNPDGSKFCGKCGVKIIHHEQKIADDSEITTSVSSKVDHDSEGNEHENVQSGLTGWLALLGLGLIISPIIGFYSIYNSLSLLPQFEYIYPALHFALQFETIFTIVIIILQLLILILYLSKSKNFPKYFLYLLLGYFLFVAVDHLFILNLEAPTQEIQTILTESAEENLSNIGVFVVYAIIWGLYVGFSKKVKATFVN